MTSTSALEAVSSHAVAEVWSGTPAGFALHSYGDRQFAAFYDADRTVSIGERSIDETDWTIARLPDERRAPWDAHNYLALTVDDAGHLHLSGNMHNDPLTYYRTTEPLDVTSLEPVHEMVGTDEDSVTYPQFLRGPGGELLYKYRDGHSGGGDWIYNVYDPAERDWTRLLDEPITYGGDEMNAYPHGPVAGPDGYYHLCWVWRDTPDAATNHDLSYARSPELREWETSQGEPLELPITIETAEVVDPVPPGGGMINGNTKLGFDTTGRPIVSYHKFGEDGNTQVYNARAEDDGWAIYETSDWEYRWEFGGHGSIPFEIRLSGVHVDESGRLIQTYDHEVYGPGRWMLDEETLRPVSEHSPWYRYPAELRAVESDHPGMQVNWADDGGEAPENGRRYALRWETLEPNRDRPRDEEPPATTLRCYEFAAVE